jgi:hypothetical protein
VTLALSFAQACDFDAAVEWQTKALERFPKDDQSMKARREWITQYRNTQHTRSRPEQAARDCVADWLQEPCDGFGVKGGLIAVRKVIEVVPCRLPQGCHLTEPALIFAQAGSLGSSTLC